MPPLKDFMEYMDQWQALDREYDRIPSWRIFKQLKNIRKREKLTKAWTARMREAGMDV